MEMMLWDVNIFGNFTETHHTKLILCFMVCFTDCLLPQSDPAGREKIITDHEDHNMRNLDH